MSIALNTRIDIDPKYDPLANPNYPSTPPWDVIGGTAWSHTPDYSGAVFADDIGSSGTYLQYCCSGHSANGATMWLGFDVASRLWKRVGRRPLPSANLYGYVAGSVPPPSQFDHSWGDFIGASADWPAGFEQPGYNPPVGSHTRGSMSFRPASKAGNANGQVIMGLGAGGVQSGTSIIGGQYYDCSDGLFYRTANMRPASGATSGNKLYHEATDHVVGWNLVSSAYASIVDLLNCSTMTWSRVTGLTGAPYIESDFGHAFICGGLLVFAEHRSANATFPLYAISIAGLIAGTATSWAPLTLSATAWPTRAGTTVTIEFQLCPVNNCFYCVDVITGSHQLYKLTPPAPGGTDAANLAGTWTLAAETLAGDGLVQSAFHYNRLQWAPALQSYIFTGDSMGGDTQAIRPIGV